LRGAIWPTTLFISGQGYSSLRDRRQEDLY
jgi:hypothetical protein